MFNRPSQDEYGGHFGTYINLVQEGNLLDLLAENRTTTTALFSSLSEEQALHRYAPGKWSLKEVLGHITDTERIMSYRLLRIARGDKTPLPGFDENEFVAGASFDDNSISELLEQYEAVRASTIALLKGLTPEAYLRRGIASNTEISARALAHVITGHEMHHINIVRERYLNQ
ncbi:DinB family protein [Paenibacillus taihuensis]|uniref:DinB family protein n=1 Tax=Paenibacillus taihuensis TaxID=1156355 RepID=A0A3D9Q0E9_9BACL|nr:DinB family protein [Paenibacillus taihuensis]REE55406.1 DinB family protein [Paenibacillus taihuensis]